MNRTKERRRGAGMTMTGRILPVAVLATAELGTPMAFAEDPRIGSDRFAAPTGAKSWLEGGRGWKSPWQRSALSPALPDEGEIAIRGTRARNNPLRRELGAAFRGRELFVRFQFNYAPEAGAPDDSEFFVLWLDRLEGGDRSLHSRGVPNVGVHVADRGPKRGKVVFMIRTSPDQTAWSRVEVERGRTYQVVARVRKRDGAERADYDQFDLWVDPRPGDLEDPDASMERRTTVNVIRWVGFSTGRKTEPGDRIRVDDLVLSRTWDDVLEAPGSPEGSQPDAIAAPVVVWKKPVDFKRDVHPLLEKHCFGCHAGRNPEAGYRLDVRSDILGFSHGEALVVPGRADESRLLEKVAAADPRERMPPPEEGAVLSDREVALLRAWINQGLEWDEELLPEPNATSDHWAFQPVERPEVPEISGEPASRVWTPVDAFVLAAQVREGLSPAPLVSRRAWIRRVALNLTGLPPSPQEVESFGTDDSPHAEEELVERLLASPHYGERWGRYWLDLARWAESHGYQHDLPRPYAWRYRDYVIDSFNEDKPYDRFLREQLAGDELEPYSDENLVATGFLAAARISGNQMDKAIQRNDVLVDIVNATGSVVLGLTLECAQCHNHKFDPLTQRDYYRWQAFFVNGQAGNLLLRGDDAPNPTDLGRWMSRGTYQFYQREAPKLQKKDLFRETDEPYTWGFYSPLTGVDGVERLPVVNRDPIPYSPDVLRETRAYLLRRGDVSKPGPEVRPGWPLVLGKTPERKSRLPRAGLADWLTSRENPLVARVWANRVWQHHFGRGIVATPSDFGTQGAAPSHPGLLDWLAVELMDSGWSTKHLHRLIVGSSTYRQARRHDADLAAIDPANVFLWQWPRRRLEAEAIRDSVLAASGELRRVIGGPSVAPERDAEELRRTIYLAQRRSEMPDAMTFFDGPEPVASCARRGVSTVALQPLYLLNSGFMADRAAALAERVRSGAPDDVEKQIARAFRLTVGREPDPSERQRSLSFLANQPSPDREGETAEEVERWQAFCQALLNLNEFIYLP